MKRKFGGKEEGKLDDLCSPENLNALGETQERDLDFLSTEPLSAIIEGATVCSELCSETELLIETQINLIYNKPED